MLCLQKAETTSIKTRTMNFGEDLSFALSLQFNLESYRDWKPNKMHLTWKVSFEQTNFTCKKTSASLAYADNDDAQRIFLLYIDRSAKIVSAFSRNPHPNTITQLQETNPWIGTWTTLKIKFFFEVLVFMHLHLPEWFNFCAAFDGGLICDL